MSDELSEVLELLLCVSLGTALCDTDGPPIGSSLADILGEPLGRLVGALLGSRLAVLLRISLGSALGEIRWPNSWHSTWRNTGRHSDGHGASLLQRAYQPSSFPSSVHLASVCQSLLEQHRHNFLFTAFTFIEMSPTLSDDDGPSYESKSDGI